MTHTPGPWQVDSQGRFIVIANKNHVGIAQIINYIPGVDLANAKVIAAAPDLLEAAEEALEFVEGQEDVVDGDYGEQKPNRAMQLATMLREAIAKAEFV